jgi:pyruvate/2-oxoglutarate/acetoin dehydrogenase E1 component
MTRRIVIAFVRRRQAEASYRDSAGISVAIIDPRRLFLLDEESIVNSINKTNHLVVVHEAMRRDGAELCATLFEKVFGALDCSLLRIGACDVLTLSNDIIKRPINVP